uniref:Uncharacterized protein n=1 Tax=Cannabis sativa TaxID=3483 RepID=A0A803RAI6_CANSA
MKGFSWVDYLLEILLSYLSFLSACWDRFNFHKGKVMVDLDELLLPLPSSYRIYGINGVHEEEHFTICHWIFRKEMLKFLQWLFDRGRQTEFLLFDFTSNRKWCIYVISIAYSRESVGVTIGGKKIGLQVQMLMQVTLQFNLHSFR